MNNQFFEKFVTIERNIAKEKGTTKLFALLQLEEAGASWDVVISSEGLPDDGKNWKNLRFVINKINQVLDKQETIRIPRVVLLDPSQPFFKELERFLSQNGNPKEFGHCEIDGMKIKHAHIIVSPVDDSKTFVTKAAVDELQQRLLVIEQAVKQMMSPPQFQHLMEKSRLQNSLPRYHLWISKTNFTGQQI